MSCQSLDLLHARVFPEDDLIERVAMRADNLMSRLGKHQVAHLRASVNGMQRLQRMGVPETDVSVSSASTCRKKPVLVGRPADCLYSGCMLMEFHDRLV